MRIATFLGLVLFGFAWNSPAQAQALNVSGEANADHTEANGQTNVAVSDYPLRRGANEFGFWGGFSPAATTIFGGLHSDEAADRKFVVAAFRYGRALAANDHLALQYTLDVIPMALATGNIVSSTTVGSVTVFTRKTAYGFGLTPLALQLDFANSSRVHLFLHVNGGGLVFNDPVPRPDAGKFAFVGEAGTGVRVFT